MIPDTAPVLRPLQRQAANCISDFLREAGFTGETIVDTLGSANPASARQRNLPFLRSRTSEATVLNVLLRWFLLGLPLEASSVRRLVPPRELAILLDCGLVSAQGEAILPNALMAPFEELWVASDLPTRIDDEHFVIPVSHTTRALFHFAISTSVESILDLGTGSGAVALQLASSARNVVATDLNPRALEFARFNAALNCIENIEFLAGDGFGPVAGRKFDRIVCNPPFFITPGHRKMYSENPEELDGFCRKLVKQSAAHLNEGGTLQMLAEWVEIRGQSWRERLSEWFEGVGCDAWVLFDSGRRPEEYALDRFTELHPGNSPVQDSQTYDEWIDYYRRNEVERILSGYVCLRRRSGGNWTRCEPFQGAVDRTFGDAVAATVPRYDYLHAVSDDELLEERFRFATGARLEQCLIREGHEWKMESVHLVAAAGLLRRQAMTPPIADFLSRFDGSKTVGELIGELTLDEPAPADTIRRECIGLVRRMIESNFLVKESPYDS